MKKFAFVSDFDGTLTSKDFYHIIIDKYLGTQGRELYTEWKKTKKINVEFLNKIFGSINLSEAELYEEIKKIPLDEYAAEFIKRVRSFGGDFFIVSAGTSFYIKVLLKHLHLEDVNVISMDGIYYNGGIKILPDTNNIYYSEIFGLDKRKVIETLRKDYEYIFFSGDSEPDLGAAKAADRVYVRSESELSNLLKHDSISFTQFDSYRQIEKDLIQKGWFNENSNS